jgi:hypothetical protein
MTCVATACNGDQGTTSLSSTSGSAPPAPPDCVANPCNSAGQIMTCEKCPYRPNGVGSDYVSADGMTALPYSDGNLHCQLGPGINFCPAAGVLPSNAISYGAQGPEGKCWRYGNMYHYNIPDGPCVHGPSCSLPNGCGHQAPTSLSSAPISLTSYTNNNDCYWSLSCSGGLSPRLTFTSLNTESGYDYVYLCTCKCCVVPCYLLMMHFDVI